MYWHEIIISSILWQPNLSCLSIYAAFLGHKSVRMLPSFQVGHLTKFTSLKLNDLIYRNSEFPVLWYKSACFRRTKQTSPCLCTTFGQIYRNFTVPVKRIILELFVLNILRTTCPHCKLGSNYCLIVMAKQFAILSFGASWNSYVLKFNPKKIIKKSISCSIIKQNSSRDRWWLLRRSFNEDYCHRIRLWMH